MRKLICWLLFVASRQFSWVAQLKWMNVDSLFGPLPSSVHVYKIKN